MLEKADELVRTVSMAVNQTLNEEVNRLKTVQLLKAIHQFFGLGLPAGAQFLERFQRNNAVHHAARSIMQRRIRLEQQRRRPERGFLGEIERADPAA